MYQLQMLIGSGIFGLAIAYGSSGIQMFAIVLYTTLSIVGVLCATIIPYFLFKVKKIDGEEQFCYKVATKNESSTTRALSIALSILIPSIIYSQGFEVISIVLVAMVVLCQYRIQHFINKVYSHE